MSDFQRPLAPICRPCLRGQHGHCIGIKCRCEQTPRCKANAELVADNRPGGDAA